MPERLGPYEILLELASGGMATVYLARSTEAGDQSPLVAIKRPHRHLSTDKIFLTMLVDEARLASAIAHPNVAKVRELRFDGAMPYIVMDYIEGASLAELRRELCALGRALDLRVAGSIVLDALAGLQAAHDLKDETGRSFNIVHRDVSPHNILIGRDGRAYITDFGIAKAEDRVQTTRTHEVKGKLAYLAPERVDKRRICTAQSDVFSMGVVLWECFAGRRLFRGEEVIDVLQEVMSAPIPRLRQIGAPIPEALDDVIARALSRDLEVRYPTALSLAHAIHEATDLTPPETYPDVSRLMETVFGPVMALRREQARTAAQNAECTDALRESGSRPRDDTPKTDVASEELLASLAPRAPTGRYAFGTKMPTHATAARRRLAWWSAATGAVAVGALSALLLSFGVLRHGAGRNPRTIPRTSTAADADSLPILDTRVVVVSLPFVSVGVTLDDDEPRELDPPADVATFEVPAARAKRHRVTALAADGSRAEGYIVEERGVARIDGDGYTIVPPRGAEGSNASHDIGARPTPPVGTVRDGFTKLR